MEWKSNSANHLTNLMFFALTNFDTDFGVRRGVFGEQVGARGECGVLLFEVYLSTSQGFEAQVIWGNKCIYRSDIALPEVMARMCE